MRPDKGLKSTALVVQGCVTIGAGCLGQLRGKSRRRWYSAYNRVSSDIGNEGACIRTGRWCTMSCPSRPIFGRLADAIATFHCAQDPAGGTRGSCARPQRVESCRGSIQRPRETELQLKRQHEPELVRQGATQTSRTRRRASSGMRDNPFA